jgi:hypothetical protein
MVISASLRTNRSVSREHDILAIGITTGGPDGSRVRWPAQLRKQAPKPLTDTKWLGRGGARDAVEAERSALGESSDEFDGPYLWLCRPPSTYLSPR